jgi:hypothetical protein
MLGVDCELKKGKVEEVSGFAYQITATQFYAVRRRH